MRWRTLSVELLLLAFLGLFLVYPLAYIIPGAASDEDYAVVLLNWGPTGAETAKTLFELVPLEENAPSD